MDYEEDSSLFGFWASAFFGSRPAFFSAVERIHSICPLALRNSSAAHFSMASKISESTRKAKFFFIRFGYW